MRFFLVPAVAALALVSSCDAVAAENSKTVDSARALGDNGNMGFGRSLRVNKEQLDSEELLDAEDRAAMTVKYNTWYNADLTPKQVKMVFGTSQAQMNKTHKELQRIYLGYYSFYTNKHRNDGSKEN